MFQNSLSSLLIDIRRSKAIIGPIKFFTEHKRQGNLFRADPCFTPKIKEPWYDWVYIDWGDINNNCVPAKILLFMDLSEEQLQKCFQLGGSFVQEAGSYAIVYSFQSNETELAHQASKLVEYGNLIVDDVTQDPILYAVSVDSFVKPCLSVPYKIDDNIINANEWIILKPKEEWYNIFLEFMSDKDT